MLLTAISDSTQTLNATSDTTLNYYLREAIYALASIISFVVFVYFFTKAKQEQNADEPVPAYSGGGSGDTLGFMIKSQGNAPRPPRNPNPLFRPPFLYIFLLFTLIFLALFIVGFAQNPVVPH